MPRSSCLFPVETFQPNEHIFTLRAVREASIVIVSCLCRIARLTRDNCKREETHRCRAESWASQRVLPMVWCHVTKIITAETNCARLPLHLESGCVTLVVLLSAIALATISEEALGTQTIHARTHNMTPSNKAQSNQGIKNGSGSEDDPAPSYETAVREGAGSGQPSVVPLPATPPPPASVPQRQQPASRGHVVFLPTTDPNGPVRPLIPQPEANIGRRGPLARRRFCLALFHAVLIYLLICLIAGLVTDAALKEGHKRKHHGHYP